MVVDAAGLGELVVEAAVCVVVVVFEGFSSFILLPGLLFTGVVDLGGAILVACFFW